MEIEQKFEVAAPAGAVWAFLTDPHRVAACLPGAAIAERLSDNSWSGTITVKVGPVSTSYRGKVTFERLDEATRTAEIAASGQDVRGKGGADMRMVSSLADRGGLTEVTVRSDVKVTGILAQLGRGMIQDVSDQMMGRFTAAMRAQLEAPAQATPAGPASPAPAAAPPIEAVSFGAELALRGLRRSLARPLTWAAIGVVVVLLWLWVF
jgi:carbon monoxide dehydrogenase subunit G